MEKFSWIKEKYGESVVLMKSGADLFIRSEKPTCISEDGDEVFNIFMFNKGEALRLADFIYKQYKED